jgi:hypothetical protein
LQGLSAALLTKVFLAVLLLAGVAEAAQSLHAIERVDAGSVATITRPAESNVNAVAVAKQGEAAQLRDELEQIGAGDGTRPENLEFADLVAFSSKADVLRAVMRSKHLRSAWVIDDSIYEPYVRIIKAMALFVRTNEGIHPVNISMAPPPALLPLPYRDDEPMNLATREATNQAKIIVFAAGNAGPGEGTVSPWCAPWVICVGAANRDGTKLASFSARGSPGDRQSWPTVVAHGIDVVTTHPRHIPKTAEQLEAEKRTGFADRVPVDERAGYTVVSGTSFAAPQVTGIIAQVIHYLVGLRGEFEALHRRPIRNGDTFRQIYRGTTGGRDLRVTRARYVGESRDRGAEMEVTYPFNATPALLAKQIILDMASPMKGYENHEVGAGFVDFEMARDYFGRFGVESPKLEVYKVVRADD